MVNKAKSQGTGASTSGASGENIHCPLVMQENIQNEPRLEGQNVNRIQTPGPVVPSKRGKSRSDTTIYSPVLKQKRFDKNKEVDVNEQLSDDMFDKISNYIERVRLEVSQKGSAEDDKAEGNEPASFMQTSDEEPEVDEAERQRNKAKDINEQMIVAAEKNKALITAPRGESKDGRVPSKPIADASHIDNQYFLATCHVEESLKQQIRNGEFVELEKLLVKQVKYKPEDERIDIVSREGRSFSCRNMIVMHVSTVLRSGMRHSERIWQYILRPTLLVGLSWFNICIIYTQLTVHIIGIMLCIMTIVSDG